MLKNFAVNEFVKTISYHSLKLFVSTTAGGGLPKQGFSGCLHWAFVNFVKFNSPSAFLPWFLTFTKFECARCILLQPQSPLLFRESVLRHFS